MSLLSPIISIFVLERIKLLVETVIEGHCFFLCVQFFSAASIIMHGFLYISSMCVKNSLLGVEHDFELKAGTIVSPSADTESVCVVTCQTTDTTYAEMLVAQSQSTCTTLKSLTAETNMEQLSRRAKPALLRSSQCHQLTAVWLQLLFGCFCSKCSKFWRYGIINMKICGFGSAPIHRWS